MMNIPSMNYHGADWASLATWLEEELLDTYKRLADPACSVADTERLRGRALFIGQLLDFPNAMAAPTGR
jgi:hypothetical protein